MSKDSIFRILSIISLSLFLIALVGCGDDSNGPQITDNRALKLRPIGLPSLSADDKLIYELWAYGEADTAATSLGKFFWNSEQYKFKTVYGYNRSEIFNLPEGKTTEDYLGMSLTLEPYPDPSPEPSHSEILFGLIIPEYPILEMAFIDLFTNVSGVYTLATLSDYNLDKDDPLSYETSGVWFTAPATGISYEYQNLLYGLLLPVINDDANLIYEAWVYKAGFKRPLSLGKFRNPFYRDLSNPHLDNKYAPLVPGEDFLKNPPSGFNFPVVLVGSSKNDSTAVFITMEPYPDPAPRDPFPLILLSRNLPFLTDTVDMIKNKAHVTMNLGNRYSALPRIEVTRSAPDRD